MEAMRCIFEDTKNDGVYANKGGGQSWWSAWCATTGGTATRWGVIEGLAERIQAVAV